MKQGKQTWAHCVLKTYVCITVLVSLQVSLRQYTVEMNLYSSKCLNLFFKNVVNCSDKIKLLCLQTLDFKKYLLHYNVVANVAVKNDNTFFYEPLGIQTFQTRFYNVYDCASGAGCSKPV